MKKYTHLTDEERHTIHCLKRKNYSLSKIADMIERSVSTVSREIRRNSGKRGYRPKQAGEFARKRHQEKPKAIRFTDELKDITRDCLKEHWSPEQIVGRLKLEKSDFVCHETIYRWIYSDKSDGNFLFKSLRRGMKKYRKRYGSTDYRGRIPNRVDIEKRPKIVDQKSRLGDWEADTVIGANHRGALLTLTERLSRLTLAFPLVKKTAAGTAEATISLLRDIKPWVHTLTYDNGREFCSHGEVAKALECDTYFAKPYHSWERGLNENTNGLLRQYFPKKSSLANISVEQTLKATERLNNRPRKCLGYQTPFEVFKKLSGEAFPLQSSVALIS